MDCSKPGYSVHGILQVRILEWVACPPSGDLFTPTSPALQADSLPTELPEKPNHTHMLNHVACETLALVRLACVDVTLNQAVILASSVVVLLVPCCLVTLSYARIVAAVLRIRSSGGRRKAFGTCTSHLTVVSMSYGMALVTYMQPRSTASAEQDKVVVLFYAVVTPMLNPLIYSLRNKEIRAALTQVLTRSSESKR